MSADRIISLGEDWYLYPREHWGTRDRAKAADLESRLAALPPAVVPEQLIPAGFDLHPSKPRRATDNARGRAIDALIEKHVGPRPFRGRR